MSFSDVFTDVISMALANVHVRAVAVLSFLNHCKAFSIRVTSIDLVKLRVKRTT